MLKRLGLKLKRMDRNFLLAQKNYAIACFFMLLGAVLVSLEHVLTVGLGILSIVVAFRFTFIGNDYNEEYEYSLKKKSR